MATPSHPAGPPATTDLRITVVGGGHVGLVSAVAFAALGNRVCVYDVDRARIDLLSAGKAPFVEPDLDELLASGLSRGALSFHLDPSQAIREADVVFVCVDTPNSGDGSVDLRAIVAAARTFGRHATEGSVLVNRSTAPVGTSRYVRSIVEEEAGMPVRVAVNPEFLAEGTAVRDFFG